MAVEFGLWGYRTAPLLAASPVDSGRILASGGIRTGMDLARALALGAVACGIALPLASEACNGGAGAVVAGLGRMERVLRGVMLLTGSRELADLRRDSELARSPAFLVETAGIQAGS